MSVSPTTSPAISERRLLTRRKTSATRPRVPPTLAQGKLARIVALTALLRGIFSAPKRFPASIPPTTRIVLNANDRRSSLRTGRPWRFVQVLVVAMRLIVGLTAVQITGVPHVVADVVTAIQGHEDRNHDDCPNDDGGRECPPGCPSCHCAHVMNALPAMAPPTVLDPLIPIDVALAPYVALEPPGPEPAALYRPPRTARG